jgi:solute:Na+ symporter, SSS family
MLPAASLAMAGDIRAAVWTNAVQFAIMFSELAATMSVTLFAYYRSAGGVPEAVRDNPDHIFPYFLSTVFPAGLTGLVVAAILAASLSSIDSALSAITTVLTVDFYQRFAGTPPGNADREDKRLVRVSRGICLAAGAAGIALAANVSRMGTVLEISSKIINGFTGPILGIFLLGMFMRRATTSGVFAGGLAGTLASIYAILWSSPDLLRTSLPFLLCLFPEAVSTGGPVLSFIWPSSSGLVTTLALGAALSLARPAGDHGSSWTWRVVTRRNLVE